jgi:hypothetical protein
MKALHELPQSFASTREALHAVAEQIVAPARKPDNEIALLKTPGGFGTPEFEFEGATMQVRVDGADLVLARDGEERRAELSTLAAAGEFVCAELLPGGLPRDDADLAIDHEAAERLGDFYAFAAGILERFKASLGPDDDASEITLWPEHFDIAFEAGAEIAGRRANYGASPGDSDHAEPYLYVGPWSGEFEGDLWNAASFNGAELSYAKLLAPDDQQAAALEFFESRHAALAAA